MTQEKIMLMRSQNWYPALTKNSIANYGRIMDIPSCNYIHSYITRSYVPQGQDNTFWYELWSSLFERNI